MVGRIKEAHWLSKISLSRDREENISGWFDVQVDFKYPKNLEEFDTSLDFFQRKKTNPKTLQTFRRFSENLVLHAFTFSIQFTRQETIGK